MTKLIEDLAAELIRQAYAEGYRNGRQDAEKIPRLTPEIGDKLKQLKQARAILDGAKLTNERAMETPQQARDRIVEQAKSDFHGWNVSTVEYVVNKRKRTIACLICGPDTGKVVRKGIAKCAPGDCFNVWIGKAIALRRALGLEVPTEYLNAPQPTEVRVGDEIYDEHYQMSGKVYAINPEYRTYGEDAGYYFGKSKGWLTYIDPRNYERRVEWKFVRVTDDSREGGIRIMSEDKTCWTCGHWLIGGGCWKDGQMGEEGWRNTGPNYSCGEWVEEGTEGTVTSEINDSENGAEG